MASPNHLTYCLSLSLIIYLVFHSSQAMISTTNTNQSQFFVLTIMSLSDNSGNSLSDWDITGGKPYCNFTGVTCDNEGYVVEMDISGRSLCGHFPADICSYLPELRVIRLGRNNLQGDFLDSITNCSVLEELSMDHLFLSQTLPDFSRLKFLRILDLSYNLFKGKFPMSVFNLTNLELLNFNENGAFNFWQLPEDIHRLTKLKSMVLTTCMLQGKIPASIGNMTSLVDLELSGNFLGGQIPAEIGLLKNLKQLELYYNQFGGTIPEELGNLTELIDMDMSVNKLTGKIPESICRLPKLEVLQLYNNTLSGEIPRAIADSKTLSMLSLYDNSLTVEVPRNLGKLSPMIVLDLSENRLSGPLPTEVCKGGKLLYFLMLENMFSGEIPESYSECQSLLRFRLSYNSLEGPIPAGLLSLPHVSIFDLGYNNLSGQIADTIGRARNLSELFIQSNRISGVLPPGISGAISLVKIDLSNNLLSGPIPSEIGNLKKLNLLMLQGNKLNYSIPDSLSSLKSLNVLDLSNNLLTGNIPDSLSELLPNSINFSNNKLSGPIPLSLIKGGLVESFSGNPGLCVSVYANSSDQNTFPTCPQSFTKKKLNSFWVITVSIVIILIGALLFLKHRFGKERAGVEHDETLSSSFFSYDVKSNMFSASIPKSLGSCPFLSDLNIANNLLSGDIPSSLGSLPTLNSLNLSQNQLSGQIPESLASLSLSILDLSHNRLTGAIRDTLSIAAYNGSFSGNPGLCSMNINSFPWCSSSSGMSKDVRTLIICFSVGSAILLVSLTCFLFLKKSEKDDDRSLKEESWDLKSFHVLSFTEGEILDSITQENLIGKGGSGNVSRVVLANGKELAVKHIWNTDPSGKKKFKSTTPMLAKRGGRSKEFDAEVETLSSIRHVNAVKLYCSITSEDSSLLVYEYMPNGSLWDRLHMCQKMKLDWETRYEIAVGAAKGLEYLHHGLERLVMHRDVKSSNILLDEFLKPRIADFGLAKIVQASAGKDSTHVVAGTHGYIAPEYGYTYKVNEKSDVYSFGVVLMELVTGKWPIEPEFGENKDIVSWVCSMLKSRESILSMVDSYLPEVYKEEAIKVLRIAILCTARLPELRPSMRSVVQMLEEAHETFKLMGIVISKDGTAYNKKMEVLKGTEK